VPEVLNPVEQLLIDERLVQPADLLAAVAPRRDVAAVGGVSRLPANV
jgi:hypothetical protein